MPKRLDVDATREDLRILRPALCLPQKVGPLLGPSPLLQRPLPEPQDERPGRTA